MAASTKPRMGKVKEGPYRSFPVKAATRIWGGTIVALDATGFAVPATTATTLQIMGRAERTADNTNGVAGDVTISVEQSISENKDFYFSNDAATPVVQADVGKTAYAVDDQTVSAVSTGRSIAGTIMGVDAGGVWLRFKF